MSYGPVDRRGQLKCVIRGGVDAAAVLSLPRLAFAVCRAERQAQAAMLS
jgi:hypothetical protein